MKYLITLILLFLFIKENAQTASNEEFSFVKSSMAVQKSARQIPDYFKSSPKLTKNNKIGIGFYCVGVALLYSGIKRQQNGLAYIGVSTLLMGYIFSWRKTKPKMKIKPNKENDPLQLYAMTH